MKRTNIECMIGWLDALRRDDLDALRTTLDADITWHGLRKDLALPRPGATAPFRMGRWADAPTPQRDLVRVRGRLDGYRLRLCGADHVHPHHHDPLWRGGAAHWDLRAVAVREDRGASSGRGR